MSDVRFPKEKWVELTDAHIKAGTSRMCNTCPVARAARDAFGVSGSDSVDLSAGYGYVEIWLDFRSCSPRTARYKIPMDIVEMMIGFDQRTLSFCEGVGITARPMRPVSFLLTREE